MVELKKITHSWISKILYSTKLKVLFEGSYVQWNPLYWLYSNFALPEDPETKRLILKKYAQKYKLSILVETGTYFGDTVQSLIHQFQKLYSIELAKPLYERAKKRFSKSDKVKIYLGDSAKVLPSILKEIKKPALFWLDGHYSKGETAKSNLNTPILKELEVILNHDIKNHVILIDDARLFVGKYDYPKLREIYSKVKSKNPKLKFIIKNDIIHILPYK